MYLLNYLIIVFILFIYIYIYVCVCVCRLLKTIISHYAWRPLFSPGQRCLWVSPSFGSPWHRALFRGAQLGGRPPRNGRDVLSWKRWRKKLYRYLDIYYIYRLLEKYHSIYIYMIYMIDIYIYIYRCICKYIYICMYVCIYVLTLFIDISWRKECHSFIMFYHVFYGSPTVVILIIIVNSSTGRIGNFPQPLDHLDGPRFGKMMPPPPCGFWSRKRMDSAGRFDFTQHRQPSQGMRAAKMVKDSLQHTSSIRSL